MKPGIYIKLSKVSNVWKTGELETTYVPLGSGKIASLLVSAKYIQPIKELYEFLQREGSAILSSITRNLGPNFYSSLIQSGARGAEILSDLLGVKLLNPLYYAKAWNGTDPPSLSVDLSFFLGMYEEWDAKKEVYNPMIRILKSFLPLKLGEFFLVSPTVTSTDVFLTFGDSIFKTISPNNTRINTEETVYSEPGMSGPTVMAVQALIKAENKNLRGGGTYSISYVYIPGGESKAEKEIISFNNLVVDNLTFSFDNSVDEEGIPISGKITMQCSSQLLITSDYFQTK